MPKILVSVVNYCDPEFLSTIKSLWDNAYNKNDLVISIVSEDNFEYNLNFIPKNQIIYRHFKPDIYRGGVAWARNLAVDVNFEYDYLIQFDSHTYFSLNWDVNAINAYCNIDDKKYIISYCPANYEINEDKSVNYNIYPIYSMIAKDYKDLIPGFTFPSYHQLELREVVQGYWVTCCYLFAPYKWVKEVGISKKSSFNTEEFNLSLRTYSHGWNIYGIGARDTFHHMSHRQSNGSVTREVLRPWADDRKEDYWSHVERETNFISRLMSGVEDVPLNKVKEFFEKTGISKEYLINNISYYSHIEIENRSYGMPPRK